MSDKIIQGVVVPTVTPLHPDESVDAASLRRLVNYLLASGVHGVWAAGTTGEFAALCDSDRLLAIETIVDEVNGRVPVIANISAGGTRLAVDLARAVKNCDLQGIAATPPYYYNHDQEEIANHYRAIAGAASHPVWVYNIPSTVNLTVEPGTMVNLVAEGTVVGVKDSSGAGEAFAQLVSLCESGGLEMRRFVGSVYRAASTRGIGAHGVIPGIANLAAAAISEAWEAGVDGDHERARAALDRVIIAQGVTGVPRAGGKNAATSASIKACLKIMGVIDHDTVTAPMRSLTPEEKARLPEILERAGLLKQEALV